MKPERRISNSVLLTGLAALMLALVALWFGLRRSPNIAAENATQSESSGESIGAVAEATKPSANEPVMVVSGELPPVIQISLAPHLIDAENGSWLRDEQYKLIPRGTQDFGGIEFHLEGMIQLQGRASKEWKQRSYREQVRIPLTLTNLTAAGVESIKRGSNIGSMYLLGGTRYESEIDAVAANLVWRYTDGTSATTPIRYNFHVRDWIRYPFEQPAQLPYPFTKVVWTTPVPKQEERALRLYRLGLANPAPKKVIQQLDFVGMTGQATLFVVGLTLDPLPLGLRPDNSRDLEPVDSLPGYTLQLQVVNPDGEAVPTAAVTIRAHKKTDSPGWDITHSTKTDENGALMLRYSLDKLESYEIAASHDDYAARKIVWNVSAGDKIPQGYTLKLGQAVSIGGTVVDEAGNPIATAKLEANRFWSGGESMLRKGDEPHFSQRISTTDEQGRWQMHGVTAELLDHIMVRATHPDFIGSSFNVGTDAGTEQKLREGTHKLVLKGGTEARILVTDDSDTPISGATVWAGSRYTPSRQEKKTGADGRVSFRNITEGDVQFSATAKGRKPGVKTVSIKTNTPEIVLKLERGSLVRGIVQNEAGEPLPGTRLVLENPGGGVPESYEFETTTGADGRFEWDGAPDEPQGFYVYKSGYEQKRGQKLYPDKENVVTLRKSRQVQGWVLDADTEKPITKFRIGVGRSAFTDNFYADYPGMKSYTDANGQFTLDLTEEENSAIKAEADDYSEKVEKLPEAQNGTVQVVLRLKPSASLRGVVIGPDGAPVAGATVAFTSGGRGGRGATLQNGRLAQNSQSKVEITDASGQFTLTSPPEAGFVVAAAPVGFALSSIQQVRDNSRIVLQAYGRIEGTFTVAGQPVADQEFLYTMPEGGIGFDWNSYRGKTDENGRFAISKVPPGEGQIARLIKTSPNSWQHSHNTAVSVQPGQTTQVTLGDSGAVLQGRVRFETPPPEGENLTIGGTLNTLMPPVSTRGFANSEEAQAFFNSPEWQARNKTAKRFGVVVGADGSLTLDSVPPGTYTLSITASKPGDQPWNSKAVASGSATVNVPEDANPRSPIRLDDIILRPVPKPSGP